MHVLFCNYLLDPKYQENRERFASFKVEVFVVTGDNAVSKLLNICGDGDIDSECDEYTLRYQYGIRTPGNKHLSILYCSRTLEEVVRDIALFGLQI